MSNAPDSWNPPDSVRGKLTYVIAAVGPMAILMSASMGPGTISSLTIAGSKLGYSALWLALISGWLAASVYFVGGKVCAITGETPVDLINRYSHPVFTYVLMLVLLYVWYFVVVTEGNILATTTATLLPPLAPYAGTVVVPALVIGIVLIFVGGFDVVKAVLSAFTVFMAAVFLFNAIYVNPDLGSMTTGVVPSLLEGDAGTTAFGGVLGGSIGIGPIWYAYIAHDNDWGAEQIRFMAWDQAIFYGVLFTIFSVGIYVSAAATLQGVEVTSAVSAAQALEPVAGRFAALVFTLGLWTAAFTTIGGMSAVAAYLVVDLINHLPVTDGDITLSLDDRRFKVVVILGVLSSIIGPYLESLPPLPLMTYAISLFNVVAPTTIAIFTLAVIRRRDVGDRVGPWYLVVALGVSFAITLYSAYLTGPLYFAVAAGFVVAIVAYAGYRELTGQQATVRGSWTEHRP